MEGSVEDGRDFGDFGRSTSLKLIGAGCSALLAFVLLVIVTRVYGQERAGLFFAATTLLMLVGQITQIGADEAVVRFLPAFRATGRSGDVPLLLRRAFGSVILSSAAGALAVLLFAPVLAQAFTDGAGVGGVTTLLRASVPFIPLVAISEVALAATRGYQTMRPTVLIYEVVLPGAQVALAVAAAFFTDSVLALLIAYGIPYVLATFWALRWLRKLMGLDDAEPAERWSAMEYWRFALPRVGARIAQHASRRVDILLVAALAGPVDAAVYTAVSKFVTVGMVGVRAAQVVAQPRLSALIELGSRRPASEVFQTTTVWLMLASWPLYVILAIFSPAALEVFGQSYVDGAAALSILCLSQLFGAGTGPVDIALVVSGRSLVSMVDQVLALAVTVVGCLLLVPHIGVTGAAVAKGVAFAGSNVIAAVQVRRGMGLHSLSRGSIAAAGIAICIAMTALAARVALGPSVTGLAVAVTMSAIIGAVAAYRLSGVLRLDALVRGVVRKVP